MMDVGNVACGAGRSRAGQRHGPTSLVEGVEEEFEGPVGLRAEGDLGGEDEEFAAVIERGFEGGDAVAEVVLAPGPATAERLGVREPGEGTQAFGDGVGGEFEDQAGVEIDIGLGRHAAGRGGGRVEAHAQDAARDVVFFTGQRAFAAVFAEFAKHLTQYSDVSVLPTPAFFYGLRRGEEISVEIESGKSLVIRLINVSEPDKDGRRTIIFELNGMTREASIVDKKITPQTKTRPKADLADTLQIGAPIPGLVTSIAVTVGQKVSRGDRLMMMEAMKMQTTVTAPVDGVVAELLCVVGETVESKDLLVRLRA